MSQAYAYYPGCSQEGTSRENDRSSRAVLAALGVELIEMTDWSCCGSTPAHTVDHELAAALSARNLEIASTAGQNTVATPCPGCLKNLRSANTKMQDEAFRERVNGLLDRPYAGNVDCRSILQILLEDVGEETIAQRALHSLSGLTIVPYYGCLLTRPAGLMDFDDPENPTSMDRLCRTLGAEVPEEFSYKMECCGAAYGIPKKDIVMRNTGRILDAAAELGADAVVTACPLCHQNLDLRQGQVNRANHSSHNIPVFYITQLVGLALGLDIRDLGLDQHAVNPKGLAQAVLANTNAAGDDA
ncbi:CoB--CoM heterodisulfide reductase iron-sulfur subunit B family protein [Desulfobaculum sp.]